MIIKQPDCLLKEYLEETNNRYEITVTVSRLSVILKELGITHKKVRFWLPAANGSSQRKQHNEIKSFEMHGFESLPGGALNKLFSSMNPVSILVLEHGLMDGDPKITLFPIL